MILRTVAALAAGTLFGIGLTVSGMADPTRVQSFLDIFGGGWDPTLAFVMAGALLPMAVAWRVRRRVARPFADTGFFLPEPARITPRLLGGAALFGVGWGMSGLCPGPAIADLALRPMLVAPFLSAMLAGFALHQMMTLRHPQRTTQ